MESIILRESEKTENVRLKKPLISIVIPYFNQIQFAPSLCNNIETYINDDIEVLIMDDNSSDGSDLFLRNRLNQFTTVKIIRQKNNVGVLRNASDGMAAANGTYLIFSAGDDFLNPSALDSIRKHFHSQSDIYIYQGVRGARQKLERLLETQDNISSLTLLNRKIFEAKWRDGSELLNACATQPGFIWTQCVVFQADVAKKAGFMPDGGIDDWGLWHNLACLNTNTLLKIEASPLILGMVSNTPASLGNDHLRQIDRQILGVIKHWAPAYKNDALINATTKKINACRGADPNYTIATLLRIAECLCNSEVN
jgi:glycosyltransferase involved in cell wall biosynthesis